MDGKFEMQGGKEKNTVREVMLIFQRIENGKQGMRKFSEKEMEIRTTDREIQITIIGAMVTQVLPKIQKKTEMK